MGEHRVGISELISRAQWREAVTYRDTWPHEYVLTERDDQKDLLAAVCERFLAGEGVASRFFSMDNTYLFIGDHKYWIMTDYQRPRKKTYFLLHDPDSRPKTAEAQPAERSQALFKTQ